RRAAPRAISLLRLELHHVRAEVGEYSRRVRGRSLAPGGHRRARDLEDAKAVQHLRRHQRPVRASTSAQDCELMSALPLAIWSGSNQCFGSTLSIGYTGRMKSFSRPYGTVASLPIPPSKGMFTSLMRPGWMRSQSS